MNDLQTVSGQKEQQWPEGIEEAVLKSLNEYSDLLAERGFPLIYGTNHLAVLLGRSDDFMNLAINCSDVFYRSFTIPKRSGGIRVITAPYPSLLECQRWIYKKILARIILDESVHGFVKGRSIITNANVHLGSRQVLKMDLKDFFPSICFDQVLMVFHTAGYSKEVSYALARLCTHKDCLPQGAPTSPVLSNIIAMPMDYRLLKASETLKLRYTRYADDLVFSGDMIPVSFIRLVSKIVKEEGFCVNQKKTTLYRNSSARKIVTGIVVNGSNLSLPKEYRRELRKDIHYIMTYGMESHIKERKIRKINYYEHILGKVNFWLSVEPDNVFAKQAKDYLVQNYESYYSK